MQLVVNQLDSEIAEYKLGQQMIRFTCDKCQSRKLIRLSDITPERSLCIPCQRSSGLLED